MLARRATPEIVARNQNLRIAILRLVEHKIRDLFPLFRVAHLVKQVLAEACALDRLQELFRDNHVRIDIEDRHGGGNAFDFFKLIHDLSPQSNLRTSTK